MEARETRRSEVLLPFRTVLVLLAVVALAAVLGLAGEALLVVFAGIYAGLVLEHPVRLLAARTGLSRGLASTVTVVATALALLVLSLLLLEPLVAAVRDFLRALPGLVDRLRESSELSWLDTGIGGNLAAGAERVSASVPDDVADVLGVDGSLFGVVLACLTILLVAFFLLVDQERLKRALGTVLMPADRDRWLAAWERATEGLSRWTLGLIALAALAGTAQGLSAWLLGSSYAVALGVIGGLLDVIPAIGATLAGLVLVPTLWAEEGLTAAIILLVVLLLYQQVETNILAPTLGRPLPLSPFFVVLPVVILGALGGVLGALVAIPLAATAQLLVVELTRARRERVTAARAAA